MQQARASDARHPARLIRELQFGRRSLRSASAATSFAETPAKRVRSNKAGQRARPTRVQHRARGLEHAVVSVGVGVGVRGRVRGRVRGFPPSRVGDPLLRADCRPRDVVDRQREGGVEGVAVFANAPPPVEAPVAGSATVSAAWLSNIVPALSAAGLQRAPPPAEVNRVSALCESVAAGRAERSDSGTAAADDASATPSPPARRAYRRTGTSSSRCTTSSSHSAVRLAIACRAAHLLGNLVRNFVVRGYFSTSTASARAGRPRRRARPRTTRSTEDDDADAGDRTDSTHFGGGDHHDPFTAPASLSE